MDNRALYRAQTADVRQILIAMGMGDFNITGVINFMFWAPATTDGDMPAIIQLVQLIQRRINTLGGNLSVTGRLDQPTVAALTRALGPTWPKMSWYEICRNLVARTDFLTRPEPASRGRAQALSGLSILPDVPTELLAIGAGLIAWHFYKKSKR